MAFYFFLSQEQDYVIRDIFDNFVQDIGHQ